MAQQELNRDPHLARKQLQQKFSKYGLELYKSYDQILFILDQQCQSYKCDRDVARQLFDQSVTPDGKANLSQMIFRYVQNLKTSALCIIREKNGERILQDRLGSLNGTKKSYVYLKIIQATIHARHSSNPVFTYKISPSDIPPVTVVNSLNPILNHQFTLQLQQNSFSIVFFESGVKIAEWVWPDSYESSIQGQYHRAIMTQAISFQLKINYKPIGSHPDRKKLQSNLMQTKEKIQVENQAFFKLQSFQPFLMNRRFMEAPKDIGDHGPAWHFVQTIFNCLPFMRRHVRNLYYILIVLIGVECWASFFWPMQFLDITIAFGLIGVLYDRFHLDLGLPMLICVFSFLTLIVKSIWGVVVKNDQKMHVVVPLIIGIAVKLIGMFLAWIVFVNKQEVPSERLYSFYHGIDPKANTKQHQFFQNQEHFDIFK